MMAGSDADKLVVGNTGSQPGSAGMTNALCDSLSVVVPVYNRAATLNLLVERLKNVLPTIAREFELLLVDDGSGDQSWLEIDRLVQQHTWVRGLKLLRNSGQHNALLAGIRTARHAITVTLDDDLQHPPEGIRSLLARLSQGCDVVYGCPERQQHGWFRDAASTSMKYLIQRALGVRSVRSASAFARFAPTCGMPLPHTSAPTYASMFSSPGARLALMQSPSRMRRALRAIRSIRFGSWLRMPPR